MDLRSSEGRILEVAERYAWVDVISQNRYWYQLTGTLKLPEGSKPDDLPPGRIRFRLLWQAENLISALSKEGWQLADGTIDISFRTDVSAPVMTLAGVVVVPAKQGSTTAYIKVLVMRELEL